MTTPAIRRAGVEDASELTRLRAQMFIDMGRDPAILDQDWHQRATEHFRARLAEPDLFGAFVVDRPDGGLAAVAIGWINHHLVGTTNPGARVGYVANMCTDPAFRRRGYGRATLVTLLDWMRSNGIGTVDLHASPDGEHLYRAMGFAEPSYPALTLRLGSPSSR
jgi:GNAT superfamily N-acetyltransferase